MQISIKVKFSIFLATLLLLTVIILSQLVLREIKINQEEQYENYLGSQTETANVYLMQTLLTQSNKIPQLFLKTKGEVFAKQLELLTGQSVVLYNQDGEAVSTRITDKEMDRIRQTLEYTLHGDTAYQVEGNRLYYLSPLKVENEQVGVIQFHYSLTVENQFYNRIKQTLIIVGASIFLISFLLANYYFAFFAKGIIKLEQMVDKVREGQYEIKLLNRRDEIGRLSLGIQNMSNQIMSTMKGMREEQEKLALAVEKLTFLDQQQKQFIGNVTHEFKTPLTSIKAYLDLLDMYPDDAKLLETAIINIKSETDRLYDMVDKVLQLSTMEKYDFEYHSERIDVKQIILTILRSLSGKLSKFGIALETELTEAYINADKDSIVIILINLLDNAIKYNKANGKIIVKNYIYNKRVLIEITDTGIGIPVEAAQSIFEPFYTVDKNRSREYGGAGLGLSLVKKYIEKQGGSIRLKKTDINGTSFVISFQEAAID